MERTAEDRLDSVQIRQLDSGHLDLVMPLVEACYGSAAEPRDWWAWRYFGLSDSPSLIHAAVAKDQVIGIQPATYFRFFLGERSFPGAVLTGLMVHPQHRGKGLFKALIDDCIKFAWQKGCWFATTMPNAVSYPLFQRLGWRDPGNRTLLVRVLQPHELSRHYLGFGFPGTLLRFLFRPPKVGRQATPVRQVDAFDSSLNMLSARDVGMVLDKDAAWLNWRHAHNPLHKYRRWQATGPDGQTSGVAATTVECRAGLRVGYIVELLARSSEAKDALVQEAVSEMKEDSAAIAVAVMSDPEDIAALRRNGFRIPPSSVSPKKFRTVYQVTEDHAKDLVSLQSISNWRQSLADWDGI
jgi:GNAT superfamily N-acetyltransferase